MLTDAAKAGCGRSAIRNELPSLGEITGASAEGNLNDPFLQLTRPSRFNTFKPAKAVSHTERAHSKFSASGAERWFNCPGGVELSEGLPDKSSVWSIEGVLAHELLEQILTWFLAGQDIDRFVFHPKFPDDMRRHVLQTALFIIFLKAQTGGDLQIETRIYLDFIHPEMFGTFDAGILDFFETLHVIDFKYGAGHSVSVRENLQMIFYGIGLAHLHHWNFKRVRLWIIQPRIKGYDGPTFWDVPILTLKNTYVPRFERAVERVEKFPKKYVEGSWCHWCKTKSICPLKQQAKLEKARSIFSMESKK